MGLCLNMSPDSHMKLVGMKYQLIFDIIYVPRGTRAQVLGGLAMIEQKTTDLQRWPLRLVNQGKLCLRLVFTKTVFFISCKNAQIAVMVGWGTVAQWISSLLTVPRDLGSNPGGGKNL